MVIICSGLKSENLGPSVVKYEILESWSPSFNDACDCRDAGTTLIFQIDDAFVVL